MKATRTWWGLDPERVWSGVLVILLVVFGFLGMWLAQMSGMQGEAVFVALLIVPALVYVIISGKLEELKGPGGLEAKFVRAVAKPINAEGAMLGPTVLEIQNVAKEGMSRLMHDQRSLDEAKPIVMTVTFGAHTYRREDLLA